jgi:lipopolysaccharide/colanic/teichoic acid biosynthesis glycosyltransferase
MDTRLIPYVMPDRCPEPAVPIRRRSPAGLFFKRILDILASALLLMLLLPLLLILGLVVRIGLGRPVLFRQQRPGLNGAPFFLFKFRTMKDGGEPDAERMTPLGNFIRSCSLDELPQLWNVLRGDMSLIGPRPLLMQYLPRYSREQKRRHDMKPGITGWAQVHGRNFLNWEDRFALDVWYVDHWSLGLDFRILLRTVGKVLSRSGIRAPGEATMTEFMGYPEKSPPSRSS